VIASMEGSSRNLPQSVTNSAPVHGMSTRFGLEISCDEGNKRRGAVAVVAGHLGHATRKSEYDRSIQGRTAGSKCCRRLSNLKRHENIQTRVEGELLQIAAG
jgi:hypothetical protein